MSPRLDVRLGPAEWEGLSSHALADTVCVVFDILRATSTVVTALAHGARALVPVSTLQEAVSLWRQQPDRLLAGERGGLRPTPELTGGVPFHLGNSPREFTPERVRDRVVLFTTTNGSRALRACQGARAVLAGAFLNLTATFEVVRQLKSDRIVLVCAGTGTEPALEDILAAGAFVEQWRASGPTPALTDAAAVAWRAWREAAADLMAALADSANAQRLLQQPELQEDVPWCLQRDRFSLAAWLLPEQKTLLGGSPAEAVAAHLRA